MKKKKKEVVTKIVSNGCSNITALIHIDKSTYIDISDHTIYKRSKIYLINVECSANI